MKKAGLLFSRIAIGLVVLALIAGAVGTYYLKSFIPNREGPKSFPQIEGELVISGLDAPVDIYRDGMGIPHIYASSLNDLFFAQGYVHAQDRFWQMDFWRHIGAGRLSEMFGESQVDTDIFLRTLGWRQVAEQEYAHLGPEPRAILDSYTAGVNAYITDRRPIELSLEYLILTGVLNSEYTIEPWTAVNSLTWGKAMAWDLRGNIDEEIERAILLKTLTPEQIDELFPPYPIDHPVIVSEIGGSTVSQIEGLQSETNATLGLSTLNLQSLSDRLALLDPLLGPAGSGIGSNSWAISGDLTASGMPLLANDPHLGIQMPSIWYQIGMHCRPKSEACSYEMSGFSFAGVPGIVIGHNEQIAWGFTNTGPDVMDLYIERINPDNPAQYEVNGAWVDFDVRTETIEIGGGAPVDITIRSSRHGPVISESYGTLKDQVDLKEDPEALPFREKAGIELPESYAVALAWTALTPSTPFEAIWGFNKAKNWIEFREAASKFHVPAQNLLYADTDGNIAYQMPGDIPIRANGDGRYPIPGWTDEYEWTAFIPFEEQPYVLNPPGGFIVTANNQVNPREYSYLIATDWNYGFRATRIQNMIANAPDKIDIPYIQSMQSDSLNLNAETLVPILLAVDLDPKLAAIRDQVLATWDYRDEADSGSAAVFEWFWQNLLVQTFGDDLPEAFWPEGGSRWTEVIRELVEQPDSQWWDDKDTADVVETRDDMFARAFELTINQVQKEYGKNPGNWITWGDLHAATFRNATLGESGIAPIEALFNRGPFVTGGGEDIVNATGWTVGESFEVDWLPSMRMIVDLGDLRNSLTVHTTGQSGHAYHPHYADMAPMWAAVEYYPMLWNEQAVISNTEGHLRLVP
jgi:penicillin G amidase